MDISCDYEDLFRILNKCKVRYIVVGAYAVIYYTEPRFTKDLDIWVKADMNNTEKLYNALKAFGAPLKNICIEDFTKTTNIFQIGVAPIRVDIILGLPGMNFDCAWKNRKRTKYANEPINILGIRELIVSKNKAKRDQDILDLKKLKLRRKILDRE